MKKHKVIILFLLFSCRILSAQDSSFWNKKILQIATPTSTPDWIRINPEINIKGTSFFTELKSALGLAVNDEMKIYNTDTDKMGFTHIRYQQYYKGYKVNNAEFLVHEKAGRTSSANGKLIKGLNKNPVIKLSRQEALEYAKRSYPAKKYAWEVLSLEKEKKEILHDPMATYYPTGELVWVLNDKNSIPVNPGNMELGYSFDIYTAELQGKRIFVSAASGTILKSLPLVANCNAASVNTNFYGVQGFSVRAVPGSNPTSFNLWNDCQPDFVHTRRWLADFISAEYVSANNNWSNAASAATSHWATEMAHNYFFNIHSRNGWNDNFAGVNVYQDALFCYEDNCVPYDPHNASMSGGVMKVGNDGTANAMDDYNTIDIIAHEFTHAVTGTSARLAYEKESGALNESFSDIFGATCKAWLFGFNSSTWKMGFDRRDPNGNSLYVRNIANPKDKNQPNTYLSAPWMSIDTSFDKGGVHTNSGVQNYMYYLLVSGGAGTNDNGHSYSCVGIGIVAAREIAYETLIHHLGPASTYADARNAWVEAAVQLYGECSFQAIETGKAWDAVGLPPPANNFSIPYCGTYGGSIFTVTYSGIYSLARYPDCIMTVTPASLVQFGGNKVVLNPGFRAQNGSHFRAYVSDCSYATY